MSESNQIESSLRLATIERVKEVLPHPNADLLDLVKIKGFTAIVKKGQWKADDLCVFVQPDSILPDAPWAAFYKAKSSRVKAIRLRSVWSEGVVESAAAVGYTGSMEEGLDLTEALGVTKYEPPVPQDLAAKGLLPYGICKTDEERAANLDVIPYGEIVDVTQKIDGQSCSFYWLVDNGLEQSGILGRTMEYKGEAFNNYTQNQANHDALNKLSAFCRAHNLPGGICARGESFGAGIQKGDHNPHSKLPLGWAMFSVWLISERRYAKKGEPFYFLNIAEELRLPTVPVIEKDVVLTPELIHKYSEGIETLNGKFFEGVVIQHRNGSFKVISKKFDSLKK